MPSTVVDEARSDRRYAAEWTSDRTVCRVFLGVGPTAEAAWEVARRQLLHAGPVEWGRGRVRVFSLSRRRSGRRVPADAGDAA
jgi:hypothetical protein